MRNLLAVCVVLSAETAAAYSISRTAQGAVVRWPSVPVAYYLDSAGSGDVPDGSDVGAVQQSFADWTNVACSKLAFKHLGSKATSNLTAVGGSPDGKNVLGWIQSNQWQYGGYVLGVTAPIFYEDGTIIEADIAFNGYLQKWTTVGQFGRVDVKSVALHEIGHFFGLQHVLDGNELQQPPTMAPAVDPEGKSATLEADDMNAACYLYPEGSKFTCQGDGQCPYFVEDDPQTGQEYYSGKLNCNSGVCSTGGGGTPVSGGQLGDTCSTNEDCGSPNYCQPVQGAAYCAAFCTPQQAGCPSGFACYPYVDGSGGACLSTGLGGSKKANGDTCQSNTACESKNCVADPTGGKACRKACQGAGECTAGEGCYVAPGFALGGCVPASMIPSTKLSTGDPCNAASDCDSAVCWPTTSFPRFCRDSCAAPGTACGTGMICQAGGPTGGVCVEQATPPTVKGVGATCAGAAECTTALCIDGRCRESCNVAKPTCSQESLACFRFSPDELSGACLERGPGGLGAACTVDRDCSFGFCAVGATGGTKMCLLACSQKAESCPDGSFCVALNGLEVLGACYVQAGGSGGGSGGDASAGVGAGGGTGASVDASGGTTKSGIGTGGGVAGCRAAPRPTASVLALALLGVMVLARRRRG